MPERLDQIRLRYTLVFESSFHCGSGLSRLLIDRAVRRDADGYLFVPGSTVKGALRDRCEQLARLFGLTARSPHDERAALDEYEAPDLPTRLFGSRLRPGELCFDDLKMRSEDAESLRRSLSLQTAERTQVSLSRRTGTAKPELLFSSEFGLAELRFEGEISGHVSDLPVDDQPTSPTYALLLLLAGLMSLDRLGGNKSTGIGRCRIEIGTLQVNNEACDPGVWLERLDDLHYAELAREDAGA
jgi:CRISPR/Cas system CSM-associated protein Csm3 (group 7 of RAMP superfamily)